MTNLETLQNAKTKEEYGEILFKFACDVTTRHGKINSEEWLDEESKGVKETVLCGILSTLLGGGTNE